jgi:hypothetical protein
MSSQELIGVIMFNIVNEDYLEDAFTYITYENMVCTRKGYTFLALDIDDCKNANPDVIARALIAGNCVMNDDPDAIPF